MRLKPSKLVAITLLIVLSVLVHAQEGQVLDYKLEDQFRTVHRSSDVLGTVVLLIGSDKKGVEFNGGWGRAIQAEIGDHPRSDQVTHLAYADLRGVPFFLKGMIRGKFPQDQEAWVLMDWKGVVAKAYEFVPKASNVLVFSPDGTLIHHASGTEPGEAAISEIGKMVRALLDEIP